MDQECGASRNGSGRQMKRGRDADFSITEFYQVGGRTWDGWVDRQTDRETEDRRTDGYTNRVTLEVVQCLLILEIAWGTGRTWG